MTSLSNHSFSLLPRDRFLELDDHDKKFYFFKLESRITDIALTRNPNPHKVYFNPMGSLPLQEKMEALWQISYGAKLTNGMLNAIGHLYAGIPVPQSTSEMHGKKIIEVLKALQKSYLSQEFDIINIVDNWNQLETPELIKAIYFIADIISHAYRIQTPEIYVYDKILDSLGRDRVGGDCTTDGKIITLAVGEKGKRTPALTKIGHIYHELVHSMQIQWLISGNIPAEWAESSQLLLLQQDRVNVWNFDFLEKSGSKESDANKIYRKKPDEKEAYMVTDRFEGALRDLLDYHRDKDTATNKIIVNIAKEKLLEISDDSDFWVDIAMESADYDYILEDRKRFAEAFPEAPRKFLVNYSYGGFSYHIDRLDIKAIYRDNDTIPVLMPKNKVAECTNFIENYKPEKSDKGKKLIITPAQWHGEPFHTMDSMKHISWRKKIESNCYVGREHTFEVFGNYCEQFNKSGESYNATFVNRNGAKIRINGWQNDDLQPKGISLS